MSDVGSACEGVTSFVCTTEFPFNAVKVSLFKRFWNGVRLIFIYIWGSGDSDVDSEVFNWCFGVAVRAEGLRRRPT